MRATVKKIRNAYRREIINFLKGTNTDTQTAEIICIRLDAQKELLALSEEENEKIWKEARDLIGINPHKEKKEAVAAV